MARTTVIVGGGIVGLACAIEAQRRGREVTLFDSAEPGTVCSFGNAGIIAVSEIFPLITPARIASLPRMLLLHEAPAVVRPGALPSLVPWMARAASSLSMKKQAAITTALAALNARAVSAWRDLLGHCGSACQLREMGMIRLIRDARDWPALGDISDRLERYGLPSRLVEKAELQTLEPALGEDVIGGLLHESDADIGDPYVLSQTLLHTFRSAGGIVAAQAALAVRPHETGAAVVTETGLHHAEQLLITAGLGSGDLLRPLGACVPLHAERGYHLALPGMGHLLNRPVTFQRESCVATPMGTTLRLAGTVEFAAANAPPDWQRASRLEDYAGRYFRESLSSSQSEVWVGSRPSLPDSLPAIGRFYALPNIGYAFGHQHLGVTQAAISAKLLCDLMAGTMPAFTPAPYSLARF